MMEQLNRSGARIIGVVMNRIPHRGAEYYGGFLYYSPYYANGQYTSDEGPDVEGDGKKDGQAVTVKAQRWNPNFGIRKYLPSIELGSIKSIVVGFQEKLRTTLQNRREPPEQISVYYENDEQEVFDIQHNKD